MNRELDNEETEHRHDLVMSEACEAQKATWNPSNPQLEETQRKLCAAVEDALSRYKYVHDPNSQ